MKLRSFERGKAPMERWKQVDGEASMKPRSFERGKAWAGAELLIAEPSFNEAAFF